MITVEEFVAALPHLMLTENVTPKPVETASGTSLFTPTSWWRVDGETDKDWGDDSEDEKES